MYRSYSNGAFGPRFFVVRPAGRTYLEVEVLYKQRRIFWTYHVNMRMRDRSVARDAITDTTNLYEVIESYPDDKYLPSYLVYSYWRGAPFHVLFAADVDDNNVRVVTAYYPDPVRWDAELKKRRVR